MGCNGGDQGPGRGLGAGLAGQPEIVVGTWLVARAEVPDLREAEVRDALHELEPLWDGLVPAERAWIVRRLVEPVEVGPDGADIRLRVEALAGLVRDLSASGRAERLAALAGRPLLRSGCRWRSGVGLGGRRW